MHQRTYDRLCREYSLAEQAFVDRLYVEDVRPKLPKTVAWLERRIRAHAKVSRAPRRTAYRKRFA
jgi:hypothetical protein